MIKCIHQIINENYGIILAGVFIQQHSDLLKTKKSIEYMKKPNGRNLLLHNFKSYYCPHNQNILKETEYIDVYHFGCTNLGEIIHM